MLYNIHYLYSQGTWWKNTLPILKYGTQNLAFWCLHLSSLSTAFTRCFLLNWQPIWLRREVVDLCFIYCHIFMQKASFCCVETVTNNVLNHRHVFFLFCLFFFFLLFLFFYRLWANAASTVNTVFSLTNVPAKWWIYCLLISSTPLLAVWTPPLLGRNCFILSVRSDFHMTDSLSIAVHAFVSHVSMFLFDETLLPW